MNRFAEVVGREVSIFAGDLQPDEPFVHQFRGSEHPAKIIVQAIRIHLNSEWQELREALPKALQTLAMGSRLLVAIFKRAEANIVVDFCMQYEDPDPHAAAKLNARRLRELYPLAGIDCNCSVKRVCKPITPTFHEITSNR